MLFLGAGSAGIGIGNMIVSAVKLEGLTAEQAQAQISMVDVNGLLTPETSNLSPEQKKYAHKQAPTKDLVEAINAVKPTILIGVSTNKGTFIQQVIEAMSKLNDRPVIFALSIPLTTPRAPHKKPTDTRRAKPSLRPAYSSIRCR